MRSVSVLLVTYTYPPVVGGSEIEAQRVAAGLRSRGHAVRVLTGWLESAGQAAEWVDPLGVPVRSLARAWREPWRGRIFAAAAAWRLWIDSRGYDIAYFLMPGLQVTLGAPLARLLGKRVFMKFSGSNTIRPLRVSKLGRLQLWVLERAAERIMVLNAAMMEEAAEAGFDAAKLCWMPNPVDTDFFSPVGDDARVGIRSRLGISPQAEAVLFVGRLASEKELTSLVEAFALVAATRRDAQLILVGDGPERASLERQVLRAGLRERVRFTGMVSSPEVRDWMRAANLLVLVSSLEGFSCVLVEAMSCALPVVVSDIPANRQLIRHGENGIIAALRDAGAIAEGILRLLDEPALGRSLGVAARSEAVRLYSTPAVIARYEDLFLHAGSASQDGVAGTVRSDDFKIRP